MPRPRIEGYAIISREGMIATLDGSFPEQIKIAADHQFYMEALDRAAAIANGAHSAEGGPKERLRRRLRVTRRPTLPAPDPANPRAILWNPAMASFDEAWSRLGIADGMLAVVGGTDVFGLFLGIGYDAFFLSRAQASVPHGRPVFPGVGREGVTPGAVMAQFGLVLRNTRMLDVATDTFVEEWGPRGAS
jgi:dihydrofolate reductase